LADDPAKGEGVLLRAKGEGQAELEGPGNVTAPSRVKIHARLPRRCAGPAPLCAQAAAALYAAIVGRLVLRRRPHASA